MNCGPGKFNFSLKIFNCYYVASIMLNPGVIVVNNVDKVITGNFIINSNYSDYFFLSPIPFTGFYRIVKLVLIL